MATFQRDIWDGDYKFRAPRDANVGGTQDVTRRSNGYENSNGMLKWQDDHWMLKAAWKELHEELPMGVATMRAYVSNKPVGDVEMTQYERYLAGYYDQQQDVEQQEFQVGRRDTVGNLDWGWRLAYLHNKKEYRNVGAMRSPYLSPNMPEDAPFEASLGAGYFWADYESKKWSGNLNAAYNMGDEHLVEFNFDFSREKMDANGDHWKAYDETVGASLGGRKYIRRYDIDEYHLTLQDTVTLNDDGDFKFTPILRADKVEIDTMTASDRRWQYSGGAALQKQIDRHWSVKTSWGTYNRHPNFYEIFGDGANLRPTFGGWGTGVHGYYDIADNGTWERGEQFDFSLNWQGKLAKAETDTVLTWFQREADRQYVLFIPMLPNVASTYYPISNVEVHGLELSHAMHWDRLDLTLSGTWQKAEYRDTALNTSGLKNAVTMTPEWVWNARLDYRFPGDKLSSFVEYNYVDRQSLDGGYNSGSGSTDKAYEEWLSALSTVDLGLKYTFDDRWKLDFSVNDVFDKGYEQHVGIDSTPPYPLAGRMYYATVECRF